MSQLHLVDQCVQIGVGRLHRGAVAERGQPRFSGGRRRGRGAHRDGPDVRFVSSILVTPWLSSDGWSARAAGNSRGPVSLITDWFCVLSAWACAVLARWITCWIAATCGSACDCACAVPAGDPNGPYQTTIPTRTNATTTAEASHPVASCAAAAPWGRGVLHVRDRSCFVGGAHAIRPFSE